MMVKLRRTHARYPDLTPEQPSTLRPGLGSSSHTAWSPIIQFHAVVNARKFFRAIRHDETPRVLGAPAAQGLQKSVVGPNGRPDRRVANIGNSKFPTGLFNNVADGGVMNVAHSGK